MINCRACNGAAVVWKPFWCSTAEVPASIMQAAYDRHKTSATKCPVCNGRGMVKDDFYDFNMGDLT